MGFSGLAAWDEDLKVLLQDAPVAGARLLQRLLRPVNLFRTPSWKNIWFQNAIVGE
jgi:hypothetical protein